ncbi:putative vacuolar amino acid transporter YPQ3 [Gossypium australe]|uniref:Putative vacuolar amino acid transporter YPQ3 n=1 Tax=Gossypium australe TaxID=47621 RepID=A0A5B6UBA2_9ROSI|nr:putative vacuolar amino acid transporter YPQ3 [Gossypium australe]
MATCGTSGECWEWARVYLDDCICSPRDQISFGLGLISVLSWGVAEIPQIITNYKEKSVEGLSLGFLITWIIGEVNSVPTRPECLVPLPTQYYMAVLYTMTTLILAAQAVYYGHIYPRLKYNNMCNKGSKEYQTEGVDKIGKSISNFRVKQLTDVDRSSSPIPLPKSSSGRELYYRSARSLSSSHTPTAGSLLAQRMTPPHSGNLVEEPLLSAYVAKQSTPPSSTKSLLCLVSAVMFISLFNFQLSAVSKVHIGNEKINQGFVIKTGRKLLQANAVSLGDNGFEGGSKVGTFLGWAMAAIYMGGRLPQICLNVRFTQT